MNQQNNQTIRRSRRHTTIIPASHWISIGYSQDEAIAIETFQNDIKKHCDEDDNTIHLYGGNTGMIPYHDMLMPHWQKFAKGLNGRPSEIDLQIYSYSMPQSVLDVMLPSLQSMNLISLALSDVGLGNEGLLRSSHFLNENTRLTKFIIGWDIIDLSVAPFFSDAIKNHPSLEAIGFGNNCGLNNTAVLKTILEGCKRLNYIAISKNNLRSEAVATIVDFLRGNHRTESLHLDSNEISNDDALLLASALMNNTNVKRLSLKMNDITEEGEKTLLKTLFDPTSMDSIVKSNHIRRIYIYDTKNATVRRQRPPLGKEVIKINRGDYTIQQKIRKKVVLALCGVDGSLFDLSYFYDLSLQLMPRVLELIQEHSESRTKSKACRETPKQLEKDALSRLFHTLRGWELPLLFENLRTLSVNKAAGKRKRRKTCRY